MFRFLHTADIHLDSPMLNLERYDGAPVEEFRMATRRAFDNIVDLAIEQQVQLVIVAGDLYDGDCSDFQTPRHFRNQMLRLTHCGIRVFLIQGNHDAANKMKRAFRLQLPEGVHLFDTRKPQTIKMDDLQVAIHGQGFANRDLREDISANYPEPVSGYTNIGVLHTNCGNNSQHDPYAPSTVPGLTAKGYDYWALGHIHKPATLAGPHPWIVYSGNPQGRSVQEVGARGCVIVSCDGGDLRIKRHDTDVVRWAKLEVDVSPCAVMDDVPRFVNDAMDQALAAADDRPLAVRLELTGATELHERLQLYRHHMDEELRTGALDRFDEKVWIEKIKLRTTPSHQPAEFDPSINELVELIADPEVALQAFEELRADFLNVINRVHADPRLPRDELDLDRPESLEPLLNDARELLLARLRCGGATS